MLMSPKTAYNYAKLPFLLKRMPYNGTIDNNQYSFVYTITANVDALRVLSICHSITYPAVKGTLWTRIGLGLVHYGPILGIEQFLIKRTRNCSVSRLVHNVLFSKRIIINKFSPRPIRFFYSRVT